MFRLIICSLGLFVSLQSCELIDIDSIEVGVEEGVRPIYASFEDWDEIISLPPQPIENLGKIYYKYPYIYVNERFKGIHVIDNTDPSNPVRIGFIQVYGCEDIAINGSILYADNYTDLVAIDISDLDNIRVVNRVEGLYTIASKSYPEGYSGYFECVEETRGYVVGWEAAVLLNPECIR